MYTNTNGVPLSLALWLATDEYDHDERSNVISVTTLLKPTKQIVLASRVPPSDAVSDVSTLVPSRMGTAIHNGLESAWLNNYQQGLADLGYPPGMIKRIRINPTDEELNDEIIPIYMELRTEKAVGDFIISGKFDFIAEGRVRDFKSTGTYTYTHNTNDAKYIMQGSLYRWLNPEKITDDVMAIDYIFTDWSKLKSKTEAGYPPMRVMEAKFKLKPVAEIDSFVKTKINDIIRCQHLEEEYMEPCSSEDLWRDKPVFKYYKNPAKLSGRSTKNYTDRGEAQARLANDGFVGTVVENRGKVKACLYCNAASVCKQKDTYIQDGSLVMG